MTVTRLTGGLTPGDGGDPRTFPAIWNATADAIDSLSIGTAVAAGGQVLAFSTAVSGYVPEDVFGGAVNGTAVYRFVDTLYFTSSGTFAKADYPWLRGIRVKCQGAGAGGSGAGTTGAGQTVPAPGGSGGVYAESFITDIAGLDASVTVTRGAGGVGGNGTGGASGAGGTSSFGSLVSANGGPSVSESVALSGTYFAIQSNGSTTGTGDLIIPGGASFGGGGEPGSLVFGSAGGQSHLGASVAGIGAFGAAGSNGSSGRLYGGGGSGASQGESQSTARTGGGGANGIVIIELFA